MLSSISGSHGTRRLKTVYRSNLGFGLASMVVSLPGAALAHNSSHEDPAFLGYLSGGMARSTRFVVATDSHFGLARQQELTPGACQHRPTPP